MSYACLAEQETIVSLTKVSFFCMLTSPQLNCTGDPSQVYIIRILKSSCCAIAQVIADPASSLAPATAAVISISSFLILAMFLHHR